ncbi:MAG: SagB/ThcOx family dehydrogenase [Desulfobacteraceae bacterium]|jgi:SagB-type dehydrogenase family enzyme
MRLPKPRFDGRESVERAIKNRRTVRSFRSKPLDVGRVGQLLWAAQGVTGGLGFKRAAPSAGALYPMDVYAVVGKEGVQGLKSGNYHYAPRAHSLERVKAGDLLENVARAALSQGWMAGAPVNFAITATYERITGKYGQRGVRYAMIEAGHIGQNLFLQAGALGLEAGIVGAFRDDELIRVLGIPRSRVPLLVMPVGYRS